MKLSRLRWDCFIIETSCTIFSLLSVHRTWAVYAWTFIGTRGLLQTFKRSPQFIYEGISKSFPTGHLERELQIVQLSATKYSCIAILWVSLVSFAAIRLCVDSQRVFIVVVHFVIDSVRKLFDKPSYCWVQLYCMFFTFRKGCRVGTIHGPQIPSARKVLEGKHNVPAQELW
jgi:hypothetical protein